MTVHTMAEAMADLDVEQSDMVQAFVEGGSVAAVAKAFHRDEDAVRESIGEAFFFMSRRIKGRREPSYR